MRMQSSCNRPLTLREAANALGLSVHTLRAWISRKQIKHIRLGRTIRILPNVVRELLRASTVEVHPRALGTAESVAAVEDSQTIEEGR